MSNPLGARALVMRDAKTSSIQRSVIASSGTSVPRAVRRAIILAASLWLVATAAIVLYMHF
jgi:hypothetical protein